MTTCPWTRPAALSLLLTSLFLAGCNDDRPESLLASARDYLAKHDSRAAVIQVKNALQKKPDLPEARFLLARALLESGDAAGAELEARKALDLRHPADQAVPLLAKALLAQGKAGRAIDELAKAAPTAPASKAEQQTVLAMAYGAQGDLKAAEAALAGALEAQPDYPPALILQSRLKAAGRNYPEALAGVEAILAKFPDNDEAWKLKGDLLGAQGQADAALTAYRKAEEKRPDFVPTRVAVVTTLIQQGQLEEAGKQLDALRQLAPKEVRTRYLEVLLAVRKGDYEVAHEKAQELLPMAPDNPEVLQLAGAVEYQRHAWGPAQGHLMRALDLAPDLPAARRLLVASYLQAGQAGKALNALQPVLAKIEGDAQMLALAGQVYIQNGDIAKAEHYLAKAAALDPADAGKRTSLALAHMARGQVNTALGELERIAATDQGTVADLALIASLMQQGTFDRALQAVAALEKKNPHQALVHDLRGRALFAMGKLAEARQSYQQALALNPGYFPAVAGLARLDVASGRPEEAKKRFEDVLAADPRNLQALLALADLRRQTGAKPEEVAALLTRAVAAGPNEPMPRLALIDHYLRGKDAPHALAAAQEAASVLPDRPEILNALGMAQQASKDLNQALATYGKWASLEPASPQPLLRMADIQLASNSREEGLRSLRKALELAPVAPVAIRLHSVLLAQGRGEADRFAADWVREHPKDAGFLYYLGDRAIVRKDYDAAARHYRAVLEVQPESAAALNNLAWVAGQQKNPLAIEYAEKANRLAPKQPALMDTLAMLLVQKGDTRRALELLQKAVELAPDMPHIRLNLAKALIQAGDKAAARKELETLNKLGGKFSGQAEVGQLMRQV